MKSVASIQAFSILLRCVYSTKTDHLFTGSHLAKRPRREHSTDVNTTSSANDQLTTGKRCSLNLKLRNIDR